MPRLIPRIFSLLACAAAAIACGSLESRAADLETHPGAAIYRKLCIECHGDRGQGVPDKYDEPLHGNRSVQSLARRIERTMPDDNVGACVGPDAEAVAAYIHEAFYSPAAQARLRPPEFDLARLTNEQFRTSVADIFAFLTGPDDRSLPTERGLKARYTGRAKEVFGPQLPLDPDPDKQRNKERTSFERVDSRIAFSFGGESPAPEQLKPDEFDVRWSGSVIAPFTGSYEFIVRTENGARLWINDPKNPFIDAWVTTGPEIREIRKSIFLLGGRTYPLALEHFKFRDKSASIDLRWKPPHGVEETIPAAHLVPQNSPVGMAVKTTFPADDRSAGYERGTGVSKAWDAATTEAALEVAEYVEDHLEELARSKANAPDHAEKVQQFARRFMEQAFRRPLTDEEVQRYVARQFAQAKTPELGLKRVVIFTLKSPRFLYPEFSEAELPDGFTIAARLALYLWDSIPDALLLKAAQEGTLQSREQIATQAERMLQNPRAKAKLRGFFHHWLELERAESISKDPQAFPGFNAAVLADLRTSLDLFLDAVIWSDRSDYRELLQADYLMLNRRLGKLYGREVTGEGFERVSFDPKERAGVVTHPYLLAAFAYSKQTSPIHRGVFLTRTIVGMTLKPPPDAVAFEDAKFEQHLTMREKITELTKNTNCMGCHATINPLGFSLENYDAIGRWRTTENEKPIDPVADFPTDDGQTIRLTGARDLVKFAAENPDGHRAFIHQLFQHTAKQAVGVYGPDALEVLRQAFVASQFNVRRLLLEIATTAAARGLPDATPKVAQPSAAPDRTAIATANSTP